MEQEIEVRTYVVEYVCDECKIGKMEFTGRRGMSNPPRNYHICNNCKAEKSFYGKTYPHTITKKPN